MKKLILIAALLCAAALPAFAQYPISDATTNPPVGSQRSFLMCFNGTTWDRCRGDSTQGLWVNVKTQAVEDNNGGVFSPLTPTGLARYRAISAANASQETTLDLRNLHDTLAIHSACSAGTATLTVAASADNTNFLTLDTVAAAATNVKQYTATTVGAGIALSPLSFRWVRITTAACGAGNTSTLTIGIK